MNNSKSVSLFMVLCLFFISLSCQKIELIPPQGFAVNIAADSIAFTAIGDYGVDNGNQGAVANLIANLHPDFIITMGDNNYNNGAATTIVKNIGKYYCDYTYNHNAPAEQRCTGVATLEGQNRFFPSLGNHDYAGSNKAVPYLNYFTLPGNEVYYDFTWGPVHFYALDSNKDINEQKTWLDEKLALSVHAFNVVYFHHSPYSSETHGNFNAMQWDFTGVDLVLTGNDHIYERHTPLDNSRPIYLINGLGGRDKRVCGEHPLTSNQFSSFCYDDNYGTLFITANDSVMTVQFINVNNVVMV